MKHFIYLTALCLCLAACGNDDEESNTNSSSTLKASEHIMNGGKRACLSKIKGYRNVEFLYSEVPVLRGFVVDGITYTINGNKMVGSKGEEWTLELSSKGKIEKMESENIVYEHQNGMHRLTKKHTDGQTKEYNYTFLGAGGIYPQGMEVEYKTKDTSGTTTLSFDEFFSYQYGGQYSDSFMCEQWTFQNLYVFDMGGVEVLALSGTWNTYCAFGMTPSVVWRNSSRNDYDRHVIASFLSPTSRMKKQA